MIALATAVVASLGSAAAALSAPQGQSRPNVLVLETDDQTLESMRVMPNVQRLLGGEGATFDRSFVNFSLCCPSRSTLFTGQYAHNHGVLGNSPPAGGYTKLDKTNWLPLWLQQAGYKTIHIGKFLNGYGRDNPTEVPPGWSEWYGSVDPSTYQYFGYTLNENGRLVTYGADRNPAFYSTDFYSRRASELISANAPSPQPFFLSVAFLAPHAGGPRDDDDPQRLGTPEPAPRHKNRFANEPLPQPPSFNEADVSDKPEAIRNRPPISPARGAAIRENYQQRLESLLAVDEGVAQIVNALRASGELDNTLIVFTSDNGFFHGEHRVVNGKILLYEPSIQLPLILRGPGVPRGVHLGQLVTNADLAPTILDAAHARAGRLEDGRSLFKLLRDRGLVWGRALLVEGPDFSAVRTYRYLYAEHTNGEKELYDLTTDPYELQSRHADPAYAPVQAELVRDLAALRACKGPGCRVPPGVRLRLRPRHRCVRRRMRVRVIGADKRKLVDASFYLGRRRVARDGRYPFYKRFSVRRLHRHRDNRLRVVATMLDGRVVTLDRHPTRCRR